jgi:hypothetical protein
MNNRTRIITRGRMLRRRTNRYLLFAALPAALTALALALAGATAIHTVTWKGSITFKPVGCTHYEFSPHAVRGLHDWL